MYGSTGLYFVSVLIKRQKSNPILNIMKDEFRQTENQKHMI